MIFIGTTFCGCGHTLDATPTNLTNINRIELSNMVYDSFFVSKALYFSWNGEAGYPWDYDTLLYAAFEGNLLGGNVNYTSKNVDSIRIKKRKKGEFNYMTIGEIPINSNSDFEFDRFDYFSASGQDYEYAFVPCINDVEGGYSSNSVLSEFEGIFIVEQDTAFHSILNTNMEHGRIKNGKSQETLGRRTPFYVSNGNINYTAGSVEATFIEETEDCDYDIENGWRYREKVNDFLTDGHVKVLKNDEGKMWLIHIIESSIKEKQEGHRQNIVTSFDWEETGNVESTKDLYYNGLININVDG